MRKAINWSKKRELVRGIAIWIEVILVMMIKYGKKFLPLVLVSALQIKQTLQQVVLHQITKIINKLRPLHLQHQDRIVLFEYAVPKSSST